jgi:hypothetical protein
MVSARGIQCFEACEDLVGMTVSNLPAENRPHHRPPPDRVRDSGRLQPDASRAERALRTLLTDEGGTREPAGDGGDRRFQVFDSCVVRPLHGAAALRAVREVRGGAGGAPPAGAHSRDRRRDRHRHARRAGSRAGSRGAETAESESPPAGSLAEVPLCHEREPRLATLERQLFATAVLVRYGHDLGTHHAWRRLGGAVRVSASPPSHVGRDLYAPSSWRTSKRTPPARVLSPDSSICSARVRGKSGCPDSNWGPLRPERSALPGCATPRDRAIG